MENTKLPKNIQQYIDLVYSEKSELNKIHDLEERKRKACVKAKLDHNEKSVKDIMHLKNKEVNSIIFENLKTNNSNRYILLVANQQLYWEQMQKMMEPLDTEEDVLKDMNLKNTISEKSGELLIRIEQLYKEVFKEDAVVKLAEEKMRYLRPEDRIKKQKTT